MGLSLTPPASPSRCKVDRYRCCGEAPARALVVGRTYRYQLRQSTRRNLLPEARGYAHRKEEELRSTGNAWERHGLFRYGALVAARIAARRSNVRKKPPRTFELATSNLIIGSGVSRALFLPTCNRAALCFRRNTFVCSAPLAKFSIDYRDTAVNAHDAAHHSADPSQRTHSD